MISLPVPACRLPVSTPFDFRGDARQSIGRVNKKEGNAVLDVTCEHCGKILRISEEYLGQRGRCNHCHGVISVTVAPLKFSAEAIQAAAEQQEEENAERTAQIQAEMDTREKSDPFKKRLIVMESERPPRIEPATVSTWATRWATLDQKQKTACIGCLSFVILFGLMLATCNYTCNHILTPSVETIKSRQEEEQWGSASMAYFMSQDHVKARLKSPASADFPFLDFQSVASNEKGVYSVRGYCDAQNAFGAMIRIDYICTMRCQNGKWSCEFLEMSERK